MNETFKFVEIFDQVREIFEDASIDHEKAAEKGNLAAARRARTKLQQVRKLLGEYRKESTLQFSKAK